MREITSRTEVDFLFSCQEHSSRRCLMEEHNHLSILESAVAIAIWRGFLFVHYLRQGNQKSLRKNRPYCNPTHFCQN
jgi:hypothetical protein